MSSHIGGVECCVTKFVIKKRRSGKGYLAKIKAARRRLALSPERPPKFSSDSPTLGIHALPRLLGYLAESPTLIWIRRATSVTSIDTEQYGPNQ